MSVPPMRLTDSVRLLLSRRFSFRLAYAALGMIGLLGLVVVYTVDPRVQGLYPVCPFFGITGFHCPGCGTLRGLHMLLRGDLVSALGYNPFAMMSLPFIVYSYTSDAMREFRQRPLPAVFIPHQWIWALVIVVIAFWTLRNVPIEPFSVLAP